MSNEYKNQYDKMTRMPVEKLVMRLGIPTTISMLVTTLYNMADTYFVGTQGTSASGAIGVIFTLMSIIQALGFMLGHGSGSHISRLLGAKEPDKAGDYASTAFFSALIFAAVLAAVGLIFIDPLMRLIGSSETILPHARVYGSFILLATPAMMSSFVLNNILRYEGRATLAMIGLLLGGLINVIGDYVTTSWFGMGIEGVGISTMLSNYISMSILLSMFIMGRTQTKLQLKRVFRRRKSTGQDVTEASASASSDSLLAEASTDRPAEPASETSKTRPLLMSIILIGLPSLARQGMSSLANLVMNWMARPYGDAAIAAMGIVMRLTFLLFAIGLGIGQGFQPVSGYNYGAKKYNRVRKAALFTWGFSTLVIVLAAAVEWFFCEDLIGLFRDDAEVIRIGTPALHYQLLSIGLVPISFIGNMLFQSIGKSGRALFLSCLRNGICYVPTLLILVPIWGLTGIQCAQPIADVLTACITLPFFLSFISHL